MDAVTPPLSWSAQDFGSLRLNGKEIKGTGGEGRMKGCGPGLAEHGPPSSFMTRFDLTVVSQQLDLLTLAATALSRRSSSELLSLHSEAS